MSRRPGESSACDVSSAVRCVSRKVFCFEYDFNTSPEIFGGTRARDLAADPEEGGTCRDVGRGWGGEQSQSPFQSVIFNTVMATQTQ